MKNHTDELRSLRKHIGNTIHHKRIEKGMTLRKLSRLANINMEKLDQYEMGKNQIKLEDLFMIAHLLEIRIEHLLAQDRCSLQ